MNTQELLQEFYGYEIPGYIENASKTHIVIKTSDWQGEQSLSIKIDDVIDYYATQAGNIASGCRTLAGYTSDWRPIDALANECLEWFKFCNAEELRKTAKKAGLEPKF